MPPFAFSWLSPFVLLPIWFEFEKSKTYRKDFTNGLCFGFFIYITLFYWVPGSVAKITQMPISLSYLICLLGFVGMGILYGILFVIIKFLLPKAPWLIPFIIPGFELVCIPVFPISFGYAWRNSIGGVQIADIGGVYLLSSLCCLYSYLIYLGIKNTTLRLKYWGLVLGLILIQYSYGIYRIYSIKNTTSASTLAASVLQTGIDPIAKRDLTENTYKAVSLQLKQAIAESPDTQLFVLPESIFVPTIKNNNDLRLTELRDLLNENQALLFGCNTVDHDKYFNSMGFIKNGTVNKLNEENTFEYYQKKKLLLIGEYIPFSEMIEGYSKSISKYIRINHFSAGENIIAFTFKDFKIFPFICIESMYSRWVAETNNELSGADVLVNISEDGWFGTSKASVLHSYANTMRAIEMRRPLIRCVNVGVSGFTNEWGEVESRNVSNTPIPSMDYSQSYHFKSYIKRRSIFSFYAWGGFYFEIICMVLFFSVILWLVLASIKNRFFIKQK